MNTAPSQYALVAALHADYETKAAAHRATRFWAGRRDRSPRRLVGRPFIRHAHRRLLSGHELTT
jgi:hypothetical protein